MLTGMTPLLQPPIRGPRSRWPMPPALFLGETRPLRLAVPDALAEATIVWRAVGKVWGRCRPDWMVPADGGPGTADHPLQDHRRADRRIGAVPLRLQRSAGTSPGRTTGPDTPLSTGGLPGSFGSCRRTPPPFLCRVR